MFNSTYKQKFEELERLRKVSNARNFTEGLIIGAAVGIVAGLLFAPNKGKDSRDMIVDGAKRIGDHVIAVVPMFDYCCDDDYYDEDEFCCEDEECCIGDQCLDQYETGFEKEAKGKVLDPTQELEGEK
ncbi:MAG: YtxH domain-containing protein [Acidaminobacteraceae bacterium]